MRPMLMLLAQAVLVVAAYGSDADTFTIEGKTYRLDGIDAPEMDQVCLNQEGKTYPCGLRAVDELAKFAAGRQIGCDDLHADPAYPKRRIGQCSVDGVDLHRWLVKEGWAVNFEPYARGRFKMEEEEARAGRFGMWKGCFVAPREFSRWNNRAAELLGAACPDGSREMLFPQDPQMPPGCEVKGKYSLRAFPYQGIYHTPGCGSYRRTKHPDRWFCSEDDARAADFRRSFTCWW